ncbi:MAG: phage late control D family protein [Methylobacterium sp.]|uniref:phage late control D family protein n=1 Tax=Methylobacterium sp. TaxID=409 RepID=UPI0025E058B0|nr:contractile injection system protein, VgrG/Pvc8 family [Methylobacterium sp.]MBX9934560.1 phage late control D family protein [Methylobacterium sp.]
MPGELRRPRGYLTVAGGRVDVVSMEIHLGREAKSDTMHAEFPMTGGLGVAFWCDTAEIEIKGHIAEDGESGPAIFTGQVSSVRPNWLRRTIDIDCHDKSKKMMERKSLSEAFKNKKGKDVIEEVAKRHGLKVSTKADTLKAGREYDIDTVHQPRELTDWDIINNLADSEGLSVALDGDTLYLGPEGEDDLPVLAVTYVPPTPQSVASGTFMTLSEVRNLNMAGKTTVKVSSWDHKAKKKIEGKKTLSGASGTGADGDGITYEYQAPGLKQDRASRIAEKRLRRSTKQERQITLEIPGETGVRARMKLELSGTECSFDQGYDIESAEHRLNPEEGYRVLVTAKAASKDRTISDG